MNCKKYFLTFTKKIKRIFPVIFAVTVLLVMVILTIGALILNSYNHSEAKTMYRFGVVGDTENKSFDVGFAAVKNMDSTRFSIDLVKMDEQEAIRGVKDGTLLGYIFVPDTFVSDMDVGAETTLYLITKRDNNTYGSIMIHEITDLISKMTIRSQNAVFTVGDIVYDELGSKKSSEAMNGLTKTLALTAVARGEMSSTEIIGISNYLTMGAYYLCSAVVVLLLLWGISASDMLFCEKIPVQRLLRSCNIGAVKQVFCEYTAYFAATFSMLFAVFTGGGILAGKFDLNIAELEGAGLFDAWKFLIACLPAIIMITAMQFLIYECIRSRIAAVLTQFFITMILGYISGCFYPSYFFPKTVQTVSSYLPVGACFGYVKEAMASGIGAKTVYIVAAYALLFISASLIVRKRRLEADI